MLRQLLSDADFISSICINGIARFPARAARRSGPHLLVNRGRFELVSASLVVNRRTIEIPFAIRATEKRQPV